MLKNIYPIYEVAPSYDRWFKLIIIGIPVITLTLGVIYFFYDREASTTMFALTVFYGILFHAITPRRFQIYDDRIRMVFGKPFAVNLSLANIREVKATSGAKAFFFGGLRFATSSSNIVEIVRSKGLDLVISPADRETFINQFNTALNQYRNSG